MKRLSLLITMALLLGSSAAWAVPGTMNFTGRLSTASGPVTGNVDLTFRIFATANSTTALWTESHPGVAADNGLVFVQLGSTTALDEVVFDGSVRYLEIQIGTSAPLTPRMGLNAVPYAVRTLQADAATNADTVGGLTTSSIVTGVTASLPLVASVANNMLNVSLSTNGCTNGQVLKYSTTTSSFVCAADTDTDTNTTYTAGTGLTLTANSFAIDTTVVPRLGANNTFTQVNTFSNASNSFTGSFSGNGANVTSLNAGNISTGTLAIARGGTNATTIGGAGSIPFSTGTAYSFNTAGTAGQLLVSGGTTAPTWTSTPSLGYEVVTSSDLIDGAATCGWGGTNVACYTAVQVQATCPTGKVVIGGGCTTQSIGTQDAFIARSTPIAGGWRCDATARTTGGTLVASAICARMAP